MSGTIRMPGESVTDWQRRVIKAERPDLDPDRIVGPATNGPRFAGETETAWKERLTDHDHYHAPPSPMTDDDSDTGDR
jgi:hypothetical protein